MQGTLAKLALASAVATAVGSALFAACSGDSTLPGPPKSDAGPGGAEAAAPDARGIDGWTPETGADAFALDGGVLPPDKNWLADPSIWKPVAGLAFTNPCAVFEAVPGKLQFAKMNWSDCGAACGEADALQGYADTSWLPAIAPVRSASVTQTILSFGSLLKDATTTRVLWRSIDVDTGDSLGALQLVYSSKTDWIPCSVGSIPETARFGGILGGADPVKQTGTKQAIFRAPDRPDKGWTWTLPAKPIAEIPPGLMAFDVDDNGGQLFHVGKGTVSALLDPTVMEWTTLESDSKSQRGAGQGNLAIWNDLGVVGKSRIRGWSSDGAGVRTIVQDVPYATCNVVPSPTQLVGWSTESDPTCSLPAPGRLWKSQRTNDAAPATVTIGPDVPGGPYLLNGGLVSWGDWAGVNLWKIDANGVPFGTPFILIVRLSSWEMWKVGSRNGFVLHDTAFALNEKYLYYAERASNAPPTGHSALLRLELGGFSAASNVTKLK